MRTRILAAVCIIAILAGSLQATETLSLLDKQRAMFDRLEDIIEVESFTNPDLQKLGEAIQLLRDAESLFPESERVFGQAFASQSMWERYIATRVHYLMTAAMHTEDAAKNEALFAELDRDVKMHTNPQWPQSFLENIENNRRYGRMLNEARTVEDALKISNIEWRNMALSRIAQTLSRQTPPDFAEALRAVHAYDRDNGFLFAIIAVRQARAGLFDDAESTYRLIDGTFSVFNRFETLLTFAVIHAEHENVEAAKERIDQVFEIAYEARDGTFIPQFYQRIISCLVLLENPVVAQYLFDQLLAFHGRLMQEIEQEVAEFQEYQNERDRQFNMRIHSGGFDGQRVPATYGRIVGEQHAQHVPSMSHSAEPVVQHAQSVQLASSISLSTEHRGQFSESDIYFPVAQSFECGEEGCFPHFSSAQPIIGSLFPVVQSTTSRSLDTGRHQIFRSYGYLTLARAAAHLGDDNMARQYFEEARSIRLVMSFPDSYHSRLIVALFDAGYDELAQRELDEYVRRHQAMQRHGSSFHRHTASDLWSLTVLLAQHCRFAEAFTIARMIQDDEMRTGKYEWIVGTIGSRFIEHSFEQIPMDPPRKPFSSRQEILDIAEMLIDEPDGTSLEWYRARIRRLAERMPLR